MDPTNFRAGGACATSLLTTLVAGPWVIGLLARRCRERVAGDSVRLNKLLESKQGTPTCGGVLILGSLLLNTFIWTDWFNPIVPAALGITASLGFLGLIDDLRKSTGKSRGLSQRQKLSGQLAVGAVAGTAMYGPELAVHVGSVSSELAVVLGFALIAWVAVVVTASSNAVNLTDGLDGLASGCFVIAGLGLYAVATWTNLAADRGRANGELLVLLASAVGATLGFLWFNRHPARVFLGDTGALALGGLLGFVAIGLGLEFALIAVAGVFVIETASVIVQRGFYRFTGRRFLLCAPLHHHFQFQGWTETKIVVRFWLVEAALSLIAVATLRFY